MVEIHSLFLKHKARWTNGMKLPPFHGGDAGSIPARATPPVQQYHCGGKPKLLFYYCWQASIKSREENIVRTMEHSGETPQINYSVTIVAIHQKCV